MVATRDSGIVTMLISATRHSNRKSPRITTTSRKPSTRAWVRLSMAISMKLACRKIVVSKWIPGSPGCMDAITSSTPLVICSVLAQGSFSTTSRMPGESLITAEPISGWWS